MTTWTQIRVNIQNIKHETEKAVLIAMPHSSEFDGFTFWISKKLVRPTRNDWEVAVSIADDMTVTLKRTSDKTRNVLAEKAVGVATLEEAFGRIH